MNFRYLMKVPADSFGEQLIKEQRSKINKVFGRSCRVRFNGPRYDRLRLTCLKEDAKELRLYICAREVIE